MIRYIADTHFFLERIISEKGGRPFSSVEEMNNFMIKQWNSVTEENDTVIIIGDFSSGDGERTNEILKKLKGKKILIKGNHDNLYLNDPIFNRNNFIDILQYGEFDDSGKKALCFHYPIMFYNGQYYKKPETYMLYGHIHNTQDQVLIDQMIAMGKDFRYTDYLSGECSKIDFNLINCFCRYSNYVPLTLVEWIQLNNKIKHSDFGRS